MQYDMAQSPQPMQAPVQHIAAQEPQVQYVARSLYVQAPAPQQQVQYKMVNMPRGFVQITKDAVPQPDPVQMVQQVQAPQVQYVQQPQEQVQYVQPAWMHYVQQPWQQQVQYVQQTFQQVQYVQRPVQVSDGQCMLSMVGTTICVCLHDGSRQYGQASGYSGLQSPAPMQPP